MIRSFDELLLTRSSLARHFLPETTPENFFDPSAPTDHGATVTLSGAVHLQPYVDHDLPFPIIVSKPFSPNNQDAPLAAGLAPLTSVTYEFTPLEYVSRRPLHSARR